ncbi:hypothetical protein GCM10027280_57550 [Micromonospora polyrhachis]
MVDQLSASDEASAMALAYRTRKPVEVSGMTSEAGRTWALPDGTFKSELHVGPERTRNEAGSWVDVDLTLERKPDGSVAPKAHPRGLSLSGARGAGADGLVSLGLGDAQVRLGWRGELPEPVLDGEKATYVEVKPGVDLVVEAGRTGFEYFLVVKTPEAAAGLATVSMPWNTGSLEPVVVAGRSAAGLRSTAGSTPVVVSEAIMWDARVSPTTGEPVHTSDVQVATEANQSGGTDLVLTPDPAFYTDPQVTYPVTIDPKVNLNPAFDGYVQDTILNTDKSGEKDLRLGFSDDASEGCGSGCKARSFLSFHGMEAYRGATVVSAELFLWNFHSWSCTATEWQAWTTSFVNHTARWGSQPTWRALDGKSTGTKGYGTGSCGDGWVSVSVKKTFQGAFSSTDSTANVGLRATSESNHDGWKKFNSFEAASNRPYVTLVYNRPPNVPTGLKVDSCYSACASPAVVRSGTPELTATVSDPDAGVLRTEYEVFDNAKATQVAKSGTAVTGVTSGTGRPWRVVPSAGAALPDGTYHWRARACDSYVCGVYSAWFTFTVNTQDVSLPVVTATPYAEKSTGTWNGGPGQPGAFTFAPASGTTGMAEYLYSLNGGNYVMVPAGQAQAEQLTENQQQVSTDLTGFTAMAYLTMVRSTEHGHDSPSSLKLTPTPTGCCAGANGDTFASIGDDYGAMRLGMQAGKRYAISAWIYVPAATGLSPLDSRGLSIVPSYKDNGVYTDAMSLKPTAVDTWQKLSTVMTIPTTATDAFVRLYNGFPTGSNKSVFWDDMSVREVIGDTGVETIMPARDGLNRLEVWARNTAGTTSDPRVYDFLVTPSAGSWNWTLDEPAGATVANSVPDTFPADVSGTGVSWQPAGKVGTGAVTLDGNGQLATRSPVLDTTAPAGFTVAAWVRATDTSTAHTAISQDGVNTSMFRLGLRKDRDLDGDEVLDAEWCFTVIAADTADAAETSACTTEYVIEGDWVSLVGIYDKSASKIRLYVNGTDNLGGVVAEADFSSGWSATGVFAMGRAWSGATAGRWVGDLDHVYAAQRVWGSSDIDRFANR